MTLLMVVVAILVVGAVAVLLVRDRPVLADDPSAGRDLRWDPQAEDLPGALDQVRFTVALRGYRMDEVDRVLDDLARVLTDQQEQIAQLRGVATEDRAAPTEAAPGDTAPGDAAPDQAHADATNDARADPQEPAAH